MDREDTLAAPVGLPCQHGVGQAPLPRGQPPRGRAVRRWAGRASRAAGHTVVTRQAAALSGPPSPSARRRQLLCRAAGRSATACLKTWPALNTTTRRGSMAAPLRSWGCGLSCPLRPHRKGAQAPQRHRFPLWEAGADGGEDGLNGFFCGVFGQVGGRHHPRHQVDFPHRVPLLRLEWAPRCHTPAP